MSVDNRLDICGALVLPVKVVGMFPDIDYEERLDPGLTTRRFGVGRRFDDKLAILYEKPRPATSKALHRRIVLQASSEPKDVLIDARSSADGSPPFPAGASDRQ